MNYIEHLIDRFKKEVILTQDSNGYVTIGASFLESFLLTSLNGLIEEAIKTLPSDVSPITNTKEANFYAAGQENKLFQISDHLDKMKFNPEGR